MVRSNDDATRSKDGVTRGKNDATRGKDGVTRSNDDATRSKDGVTIILIDTLHIFQKQQK